MVLATWITVTFGSTSVDASFKFLPYQLWMVGYWPTMALTGNYYYAPVTRQGSVMAYEDDTVLRGEPRIMFLLAPQIAALRLLRPRSGFQLVSKCFTGRPAYILRASTVFTQEHYNLNAIHMGDCEGVRELTEISEEDMAAMTHHSRSNTEGRQG